MPYADREKDKEYHKRLMRKRREGVTEQGVTQYHPAWKLLDRAYLGYGEYSMTSMDTVSDLLDTTTLYNPNLGG